MRLRRAAVPTLREIVMPSRAWPSSFGRAYAISGPRDSRTFASNTRENATFPPSRRVGGNVYRFSTIFSRCVFVARRTIPQAASHEGLDPAHHRVVRVRRAGAADVPRERLPADPVGADHAARRVR